MLKVKHKRVVQTEELTKPREADQSFPYTNLPSREAEMGKDRKSNAHHVIALFSSHSVPT